MLQLSHRRALLSGGYDLVRALGSDLLAWWDASRADLITQSGEAVSSWKDVVGGYNLAQGTGSAQPMWSATSFGSAPGVTFDGVDDNLTATDAGLLAALPVASAGSELWVLCQQDAPASDSTSRYAVSYGGASLASARNVGRALVGSVNRARGNAGDGSSGQAINGAQINLSSRHVLRWAVGASASVLTADGVNDGTLAGVPNTSALRLRLGSQANNSAGNFWQGVIAAALVTKPLDFRKAADLQRYLLSRRRL